MEDVERIAVVISPKKPFKDWVKSVDPVSDDGGLDISTVYLIPPFETEQEINSFLQKRYAQIFENELEAWYVDEDVWPKNRTYKMFKEWLDVKIHDMVFDLSAN